MKLLVAGYWLLVKKLISHRMHTVKKILKGVIYVIILLWVLFFGIIIYGAITDYKPDDKTIVEENSSAISLNDSLISILSWNIGYCGLDDGMDFFYDGGTRVRTSRENYNENFTAVKEFLRQNDTIDFILLQEVDRKSKRSYRTDQYAAIKDYLSPGSGQFAANYDVFFVPVPPSSPMGKVYSGIATLGRNEPSTSVRYSFPGQYGFPKQLFMLDRCFLVNRYRLSNGKELVLINTHNEAFDPGHIRRTQMEYLKSFLLDEYSKGNYIIAGGDWNQSPPDFNPSYPDEVNTYQMKLESDYLPEGWKWAYDNSTPSNRTVVAPYNPAVTATTVIDFFLLSPNINSINVRCIDLDFKNSDHNPVILNADLLF